VPLIVSNSGFTQEQEKLCKVLLWKKDYYEILGLKNDCSINEIRRAYKKSSLKFHPDKNKATQATEAFKKLSAAYKCLSDKTTRWNYDQR
jgi:DnaJ homolog subfamily B member 12